MAVTCPAARVAVGVISAGPPVAVGTSLVPDGAAVVASTGVAKPAVADRAGVEVGRIPVAVAGTTDDEVGRMAVLVTGVEGSVGRAVKVWATAVLNCASAVAAESTVGPGGTVGVKIF